MLKINQNVPNYLIKLFLQLKDEKENQNEFHFNNNLLKKLWFQK